jgi:putative serine protease PepD
MEDDVTKAEAMRNPTEQHPAVPNPAVPNATEQYPPAAEGADRQDFNWYGGPVTPPGASPDTLPAQPGDPVAPTPGPPPAWPAAAARPGRGGRRRWVDVGVAAGVAALVSGGVTAAVLSGRDDAASTASTTAGQRSGPAAAGTGAGPVSAVSGTVVDWSEVAQAVQPSVVAISSRSQQGSGQGSGVLLDGSGRVLTNNHVVAGAGTSLSVTLSDGRSFDAEVVGTDPTTDLAVIAMKGATDLTPARLGDSESVQVGAPVMALGNPLGLAGTVTTGIVSALDRPVSTSNQSQGSGSGGETVVTNAIQTDAAVNPGNSGGALVDATGRVIGVPSSIASLGQSTGGQPGSIGLGFAIPINEAKSIADQLIADGNADHPFLGVSLRDGAVTQGAAKRPAAQIQSFEPGKPAEQAGIKAGDAVLAVDGESVNSKESLVAQVRERQVGDQIELTIVRGGQEQKISVTLTQKPGD